METELVVVREQPIQIGNCVRSSAACLAVEMASDMQSEIRFIFSNDNVIQKILMDEEDSTQDMPDTYGERFFSGYRIRRNPRLVDRRT